MQTDRDGANTDVLAPGATLGPYRIERLLGEGGMGSVYRARDTRVDRLVAIKIVKAAFTDRFEREARAIAALNHPHVCRLYDLGTDYLVMEFVEGETLADRLRRGKLTIEQTLEYGSQIADGLHAAHSREIMHRDLKPQNIIISKSGAKVLDFGLAKTFGDETLTASGAVMGTPAYMAPEQREGKDCGSQTDIYALGLILYEMATGGRFSLDTSSDFARLPETIAHVIERCLAKNPEDRWSSARDVKLELEWARQKAKVVSQPHSNSRMWVMAAIVALIGLTALFVSLFDFRRAASVDDSRPLRLAITAPEGVDFRGGSAISPDGRSVVFVGRGSGVDKLWIRPLDSLAPRELQGTEGATYPFWSPDSRLAAFFAVGKLKYVDVQSGAVNVICDVGLGRGGTWSEQGIILFNSVNDGPLLSVPATGGTPVPITTVNTERENSHRFPYFLPGGRRFLYYIRSGDPNTGGVYAGSLDRPQEKVRLLTTTTAAIYVHSTNGRSGYLAWVDNGNLMAQAFEAETGQLRGQAVALAQNVKYDPGAARYGEISASNSGTLVYASEAPIEHVLTWFSRDGKPLEMVGGPDAYEDLRISPDGKSVAVTRSRTASHTFGVAALEFSRGIATPLGNGFWGAWSPDGKQTAWTTGSQGPPNVYKGPIDRHAEPERLTQSPNSELIVDWSGDGRFILYAEQQNDVASVTESGLWVVSINDRKTFPVVRTAFRQAHGQFSPDSKWIAYTYTNSGRSEIYVQSFPMAAAKTQVSNNGGDYPRWSRDGNELFYLGRDQTLMSVAVRGTSNQLEFSPPVPMFKVATIPALTVTSIPGYPYDVAADGQRILGLTPASTSQTQTLIVVSNWQAELGSSSH